MSHDIIHIGDRRELFVDDYLIEALREARRILHHPVPREVALERNAPWEGNVCSYTTVFRDGDLYRMYYRGDHQEFTREEAIRTHPEVACYAESSDGIHWTKPDLGLVEFEGSKGNNIVRDGLGCHNFTPFIDTNPDCPDDARYKAVGRGPIPDPGTEKRRGSGLYAFRSSDALRWELLRDEPVITEGAFDSQNLAFWDKARGEYRAYFRDFRDDERDIRTCTSPDFVNWSAPAFLDYSPSRVSQLYTNVVIPYYRAPHLFLGFPGRYIEHESLESVRHLPQPELRQLVSSSLARRGRVSHDTMLMSSRDGLHFDIWPESFIRPGIQRPGSWCYGDSRQNWGLVETKSVFEGAPDELSVYVSEGRFHPEGNRLRRYTLRVDGFVSVQAPLSGGEVVTRPLAFEGTRLEMNFSTSATGRARVELQDERGLPVPGYALDECDPQFGDELGRIVSWKSNEDVSPLSGRPVRLRFELRDVDLYSFRFPDEPPDRGAR